MKLVSLSKIKENEIISFSHLFKGINYTICDPILSFVWKNDNDILCGFVLARRNNINLKYRLSDKTGITADMVGCEILQVYADSINNEMLLLKRLLQRITIWCYDKEKTFHYLWSESLSDYDFYADNLECKKTKQYISAYEIKNIIYNKFEG